MVGQGGSPPATAYHDTDLLLFRKSKQDSFPNEYCFCNSSKSVPAGSCILALSTEYDEFAGLIIVG